MKSIVLTAAALSAAAVAQTTPTPPAANKGSDGSRVVCITDNAIGSRVNRRRVCRTEAEWALFRSQQRDVIDHQQRMGSACGSPGSPGC
jgi:hypothetical protein